MRVGVECVPLPFIRRQQQQQQQQPASSAAAAKAITMENQ